MNRGSLQKKVTLLFTVVSFTIVAITLFALLGALILTNHFNERQELRHISGAFKNLINQTQDETIISEKFYALIHEQVGDLEDSAFNKYQYFVYNEVGELVLRYPQDSDIDKDKRTVDWAKKSEDVVVLTWTDWLYFNKLVGNGYSMVVTSKVKMSFINSTLITSLFLCPLILLLCYLVAKILSHRMVNQLVVISDSARQIAAGKYDVRIPSLKTDDEREELVKTLNDTFRQLEEAIFRVQRFSSDVAHELRTPLTAIMGNLEVALSSGNRTYEDYENTLVEMMEEMAKLKKIVDVLLLISKPRENFINRFEIFKLQEVGKAALDNLEALAIEKEIELSFVVEENVEVFGLPDIIERAVTNLLHNAIKFTPAGKRIEVKVFVEGEMGCLSVKDSGIGIGEEDQKRIFERFYQIDSARNIGSGLGLSLVDWSVKIHNGSVLVASKLGEGACFTLKIPKK